MTAIAVRRPPPLPADRDLPGAAELLADAGVARAVRFLDERGLEPHQVEPVQAHYRPGRWLLVCFRTVAVERSSGREVTPTVTVQCRPGGELAIWSFPDDPVLHGLPAAADAGLVCRRLRPHPLGVDIEPLRYRPRRRAVLRYRLPGTGRVLFGKVVSPARGRRLLAQAAALRPTGLRLALPAGRVAAGALVLPALPGSSLRDRLLAGERVPDPARLAALSDELHRRAWPVLTPGAEPAEATGHRRRVDPAIALSAARTATRLLPDQAVAAGRLAEAVIGWSEVARPPEERIVHGDLYEAQILVAGDDLGLLDLDDLGPGDPLLDAANFAAHLLLLGTSDLPGAAAILRYRDELRAAYLRRLDADPADLAWREAYCLLRLASGPFRVLHPSWPSRMAHRLALAAEVLSARP